MLMSVYMSIRSCPPYHHEGGQEGIGTAQINEQNEHCLIGFRWAEGAAKFLNPNHNNIRAFFLTESDQCAVISNHFK